MKKILVGALIVGSFVTCGFVESHYTRVCTVVACEGTEVKVADCGESWAYYTIEENAHQVGDEVELLMSNNGTDNDITDDLIIDEFGKNIFEKAIDFIL